jgi:hypothetical protein
VRSQLVALTAQQSTEGERPGVDVFAHVRFHEQVSGFWSRMLIMVTVGSGSFSYRCLQKRRMDVGEALFGSMPALGKRGLSWIGE